MENVNNEKKYLDHFTGGSNNIGKNFVIFAYDKWETVSQSRITEVMHTNYYGFQLNC